jgi:hypothetical protein
MENLKAISVRPATSEDLPAILEIERESHPEPWSEIHFQKEMDTPYSRVLVLTDDETDSVVLEAASKAEVLKCCLDAHRALMALKPENVAKFEAVERFLSRESDKLLGSATDPARSL